MNDILTASESSALAEHEAVIERGIRTFYEVGTALTDIRDRQLYRADYGTFEEYAQQRWQMSRPRAYQLIEAAAVVSTTVDNDTPAPVNERQARELGRIPEPERASVWAATVERTDGKPTAAAVRETYEQRQQPASDADLLAGADYVQPDGPGFEAAVTPRPSPERAPDRQPRVDASRTVLVALTELRQTRESLQAITAAHLARQDEETRRIWAARLNTELEALTGFHKTLIKEINQ